VLTPRRNIRVVPTVYLFSTALLLILSSFGLAAGHRHFWRMNQEIGILQEVIHVQMLVWAQGSVPYEARSQAQLDMEKFSEILNSEAFIPSFDIPGQHKLIVASCLREPRLPGESADKQPISYGELFDERLAQAVALFESGNVTWISLEMVEVDSAYYRGSLCEASAVFRLERRDGKWTVVAIHTRMVS